MNAEEAIQQVVVKGKKKGAKFPSVSSSTPEPSKAPKVRRGREAVRVLGAIAREQIR